MNRHHLWFEKADYIHDPNLYPLRTNVAFIHLARIAVHNALHAIMTPPPLPHPAIVRDVLDTVGNSNTSDAFLRDELLQDALSSMFELASTSARPEIADNAKELHDHLLTQRVVLNLGSDAISAVQCGNLEAIADSIRTSGSIDQSPETTLLHIPRRRLSA